MKKKSRKKSKPSPEAATTAAQQPPTANAHKMRVLKKPLFRGSVKSASSSSPVCTNTLSQSPACSRPYSIFKSRNSGGGTAEAKYSIFKSRNSGGGDAADRGSIDVIAVAAAVGPAAVQFGRREKKTVPSTAAISDWEEGEGETSVDFSPPTLPPPPRLGGTRRRNASARSPDRAPSDAQEIISIKTDPDEGKTSLLEIDIIDDEFSSVRVAESPNTKVRVVDHQQHGGGGGVMPSACSPRKLVFGLHSPICQDEIRPMGSPLVLPVEEEEESCNNSISPVVNLTTASSRQGFRQHRSRDGPTADKSVRPALRTHGRVISSEDAMMAIDAVVVVPVMSPAITTPQPLSSVQAPTPTLPILSPHISATAATGSSCDGDEEAGQATHSNMTTPSLPSLSPAMAHIITEQQQRSLSSTPVPSCSAAYTAPSSSTSSPRPVVPGPPPSNYSDCSSPPPLLFSPPPLNKDKAKTARKNSFPPPSTPDEASTASVVQPAPDPSVPILEGDIWPTPAPVSEQRRQSGNSEGSLVVLDPQMSQPLCVEIPAEAAAGTGQKRGQTSPSKTLTSHKKPGRRTSTNPTTVQDEGAAKNSEAQKVPDSPPSPPLVPIPLSNVEAETPPVSTSTTGRRMRDCRKFIHYEFSPPFVLSDESSTDQESPLSSAGKSYRDASYPSPVASKAEMTSNLVRRGRQPKMKSLDIDQQQTAAELKPAMKKSRSRRPKGAVEKADGSSPPRPSNGPTTVSEMAQRLAEDHISPITRQWLTFVGERRGSLDTAR